MKSSGLNATTELWRMELETGKSERVVSGYGVEGAFDTKNYSLTRDGLKLAFVRKDDKGNTHLWLAATDHFSSPVKLASEGSEDSPEFLPSGDLVYRANEGGKNFLYTQQDGTGRRKLMEEPILKLKAVSPDGRWAVLEVSDDRNPRPSARIEACPISGGESVPLCQELRLGDWSVDGKYFHMYLGSQTYLMEVNKQTGLPEFPESGISGEDDLKSVPKVKVLPRFVNSVLEPERYSFAKKNVRRNIFRVPIE